MARNEKRLYIPVLQTLQSVFDRYYVAKPVNYPLQSVPIGWLKNPYLEITAKGGFSERLKNHFDYHMFGKLYAERLHPDIMGFVTKKKSSQPEMITVEVKDSQLKLRDVMQTKLYEAVFRSKFSFLISPTGIEGEKMEVILEHDKALRGNVIIGKCGEDGNTFRINPKLANKIPKAFRSLCHL
jgi:hypothetical protein